MKEMVTYLHVGQVGHCVSAVPALPWREPSAGGPLATSAFCVFHLTPEACFLNPLSDSSGSHLPLPARMTTCTHYMDTLC